ncbi:MAG: guanylate kinase [Armatimonadetes bacterium]|nr:guanylate kinase [Armatimonadota bacterium]
MSKPSALGLILVISGPSGVGKDTVWQTASACLPSFERAITCTTRERRPHEVEGVNYHFVSSDEFERMIRDDELIEYAQVHGNFYGVPQKSVLDRINNGLDVVCVIDVQGALRIRGLFPAAVLVFIKPPQGRENQVLEERIQGRSAVEASELETRLKTASWELSQVQLYDYQIENDDLQRAANELCEVIEREKARRMED